MAYHRVLAAALLCYAALGAVLRALPERLTALGAGPFAVGVAVGAPAITGLVARPSGGRSADRLGPRVVMRAGAVLMAVGVAPAVIGDVAAQVGSRLLVGVGEGLMMSAAVLWLLRLAGPDRRGRALGHIGLANYGGLAAGPLLADAAGGFESVLLIAGVLPVLGAAAMPRAAPCGPARDDSQPAAVPQGVGSAPDRDRSQPPAVPEGVGSAPDRDRSQPRAAPEGVGSAPDRDRSQPPAAPDGGGSARERPGAGLLRATWRPGVGLMLVNVGYAAVLAFGGGRSALVVPAFAITVIAARTLGAGIPDRLGARRTLAVAAPLAAAGLLAVALVPAAVVPGVAALGAGQALAVPALGLIALARTPPERHGAAAGMFFSWFDAGVGLGGPAAGFLAHLGGPSGALVGAAVAVACTAPVALLAPLRHRGEPLVN